MGIGVDVDQLMVSLKSTQMRKSLVFDGKWSKTSHLSSFNRCVYKWEFDCDSAKVFTANEIVVIILKTHLFFCIVGRFIYWLLVVINFVFFESSTSVTIYIELLKFAFNSLSLSLVIWLAVSYYSDKNSIFIAFTWY